MADMGYCRMKIQTGVIILCGAYLVLAGNVSAKSLIIANDTTQTITSMAIEGDADRKTGKKPKKNITVGLASAPGQIKNKHEEKKLERKAVEIGEIAEEDCISNLEFTLGDGKLISTPRIDLCNLDGIIVEDAPDQVASPVIDPSIPSAQ
jgi:hypothetical protein